MRSSSPAATWFLEPAHRAPLCAGKQIQVLSGHLQWVYCCSISPDCSMLCSAAGEKSVRPSAGCHLHRCPSAVSLGGLNGVNKASASRSACAGGMLPGRAVPLHASLLICVWTQTPREVKPSSLEEGCLPLQHGKGVLLRFPFPLESQILKVAAPLYGSKFPSFEPFNVNLGTGDFHFKSECTVTC